MKDANNLVPYFRIISLGFRCLLNTSEMFRACNDRVSLGYEKIDDLVPYSTELLFGADCSTKMLLCLPKRYARLCYKRKILRERLYSSSINLLSRSHSALNKGNCGVRQFDQEIETLITLLDLLYLDTKDESNYYEIKGTESVNILHDILPAQALMKCLGKRIFLSCNVSDARKSLSVLSTSGVELRGNKDDTKALKVCDILPEVPALSKRLQKFYGIDPMHLFVRSASLKKEFKEVNIDRSIYEPTTGVHHFLRSLVLLNLDAFFSWQYGSIQRCSKASIKAQFCRRELAALFNLTRRQDLKQALHYSCRRIDADSALMSAWIFCPLAATNFAFQVQSKGAFELKETYDPRADALLQVVYSICSYLTADELKLLVNKTVLSFYDLIAFNPVPVRYDFRISGCALGVVSCVDFAGKGIKNNLQLWRCSGDKTVRTFFNRLEDNSNSWRVDAVGVPVSSQLSGITKTHRSAFCPVYILCHMAPPPPAIAIFLLQRLIIDLSGKSISASMDTFTENQDHVIWLQSMHEHTFVVQYALRSLFLSSPEVLMFYLPQLVQLLRRDALCSIRCFIEEVARKSNLLCHQLIWLLETESVLESTIHSGGHSSHEDVAVAGKHRAGLATYGFCNTLSGVDPLPALAKFVLSKILSSLSPKSLTYANLECEYFNKVTNISAKLALVKDKSLHNQMINDVLCEMDMYDNLYMPTNPRRRVVGVDVSSGTPMQSAAKCPFLLVFRTKVWDGPDSVCLDLPSCNLLSPLCSETEQKVHIIDELERMPVLRHKSQEIAPQSSNVRRSSIDCADSIDFQIEDVIISESDPPQGSNQRRLHFPKESETTLNFGKADEKSQEEDSTAQFNSLTSDGVTGENTAFNRQIIDVNDAFGRYGPARISNDTVYKDLQKSMKTLLCGRESNRRPSAMKGRDPFVTGIPSKGKIVSPKVSAITKPVLLQNHFKKDNESAQNDSESTACIFKVYDDCRQDAMTIQIVRILRDAFSFDTGLPLYLYPYTVVPNRTGPRKAMGGIIEVFTVEALFL
jgi:hypothetical protein